MANSPFSFSNRCVPLDQALKPRLRALVDGKAKPLGALGRVEDLALHIGLVTQTLQPDLGRAAIVIFAGDHGVIDEGVAAYPSDVSSVIAEMILAGTAGASIAARASGAAVFLADAGLAGDLPGDANVLARKVGRRTRNFAREAAMGLEEAQTAFERGVTIATDLKMDGYGILALGEVGIGNSSAAAAVSHQVTGLPLSVLVGAGAGAPPEGIDHKRRVIAKACERAGVCDPFEAMRQLGGYEMAMMLGAIFGGVENRQILLVDGFIATAVACTAVAMDPHVGDYLLYAHLSPELGHAALLEWLGAKPLLDLGMRLGEGTGAALAIPIVRMAEGLLSAMADLPGAHPA